MYQHPPFFYPNPLIQRNKQYVRQYLSSPIVLILAILLSVQILLGIISSVVFSPKAADLGELFVNYLESSLGDEITFSASTSVSIPVTTIVLAVAFFLMYFGAKKNSQKATDENGTTLYWVIAILQLIGSILAIAIYILAVLAIFFLIGNLKADVSDAGLDGGFSTYSSEASVATAFIIALTILMTALIAVVFVYAISELRFASSLKKSLTTVELRAKGAKTYGVFNVIFSVFSCFGVIFNAIAFFAVIFAAKDLTNAIGGSANEGAYIAFMAINLISSVVSFANCIYTAKFALGYSKHIAAAGPYGCNLPMPVAVYDATAPQPIQQVSVEQNIPNPYPPAETTPETSANAPTVDNTNTQTSQTTTNVCPQCGTLVAAGHSFCSNCGTKIV